MAIGYDNVDHISIVLKTYISAGTPIIAIEDIKLANKDKATGTIPMFPPANKTSLVLWLCLFLIALYTPILRDMVNVTPNKT